MRFAFGASFLFALFFYMGMETRTHLATRAPGRASLCRFEFCKPALFADYPEWS